MGPAGLIQEIALCQTDDFWNQAELSALAPFAHAIPAYCRKGKASVDHDARGDYPLCRKRKTALAIARTDLHRSLSHPVHIILLVSTLPLFLGALLSDWAYSATVQVQWINFAAWLNAGALVFLGVALLWSVVAALRPRASNRRASWIFVGAIAVTFVVGFVGALIHAKDAGATMPAGLYLSAIVLILDVITIWLGFAGHGAGDAK